MDNFRDSYFNVNWDLTTKYLRGTYWGKQYDTGRGFAVTVINGGQVVTPTNEVLRLKWEKPDNTTGYVNATIVNGKFIIENIDQMFTVQGSVRADFELSVGGEFVASITFYVNVEKAVAVDAIESSSDFSAFQQSVADFSTAMEAVTPIAEEIIDARDGEVSVGEKIRSVDAQLVQTKARTQITPDDFEGNDAEKIKQALYYAIDNNIPTIELTRTYDLTGYEIDLDRESLWSEITFNNGVLVKSDSGFMFTSTYAANNRNSPHFLNTHFYGSADAEVVIFNGDKMIRQNMTKCRFKEISLVHTTSYIQSLRLINCETTLQITDFIKADNGFDLKIIGHRGEASYNSTARFMNLVTSKTSAVSYIDLQIKDSLFEGYVNIAPFRLGTGYNLQFNGVYFEGNAHDIDFVNPRGTSLITGSISNCMFNRISDDIHVLFSSDAINTYVFKMIGNTITTGADKTFTNKSWGGDFKFNWRPGGARLTTSNVLLEQNSSYNVRQIDKTGTPSFEVDLPLNDTMGLSNYNNLQFLFNCVFTFGNSADYRGHLTGILTIDKHYVAGSTMAVLNCDVLSTRNTSGNSNGNLANATNFDYYFKQTGTKIIPHNARQVTLVIEFPAAKYSASNKLTIKNIYSMVQIYSADY